MGNPPVVTTSFIGRSGELDRTERALDEHRLVTLTGPGGIGKSRLALHVADRTAGRYTGGVCWADLSHLHGDASLTTAVCDAVGLLDHSRRRPVEALSEWLADQRLLLVLDCCERVLAACRDLVEQLLAAAPGLRVLATSREPLDVVGECAVEVPPLAPGSDAQRLFRERAALTAPDRRLDLPVAAAAVGEICRRLEGIPLAVELACARLRESEVEELLDRLGSRLGTLVDDTTWPRRHRALRTTIGWSHELCSPIERLLWARLSVFRGVIRPADAQAVCAGGPLTADGVARGLERLAAQSVLQRDGAGYRMLDTLREYGAMWLGELAEAGVLADRHAAHFADVTDRSHAGWLGPRQLARYRRVDESHTDLSAALDHLLVASPALALRMAGQAGLFWSCCGHLHQARTYLERVLALHPAGGRDRTRALWALGITLTLQGDHGAASGVGEECARSAREDADAESILSAAHTVSFNHLMAGRPQEALAVSDGALRELPVEPSAAPSVLRCRVIRLFALTALGRLDEAYEDAVGLQRISLEYGERWARGYADHQLALIHMLRGRPKDAEIHARAMLTSKHQLRDSLGIALALDLLAGAIAAQGDGVGAARTLGTGQTFWRMVGHPQRGTPELGAIRDRWERLAREAAGESAYETAYDRALKDTAEHGLAHALRPERPPG
ncbi:NB-ARC domain-containing protein [Streptomyces sp. AM 2-1-1]|uniref:ATP-binding protein n=1 Tax=Streptomyces sp. AM 2-1-1 TaxID=3028709 RepID=UPI0023B894DA|nr:NB-ARC domain-containing protein [Streptomyces sp. AM 2-1-1]WEH43926.1 NB-ARC domain-containing protein [Streptomyces sp. AM 2-1-1]